MTAWLLVTVVAFLNQLGPYASTDVLKWLGIAMVSLIGPTARGVGRIFGF